MIHIRRTTEPTALRTHKTEWTQKYRESKIAYRTNPSKANKREKTNAENKYRHQEIKTSLKEMFHGKCAYCKSEIPHVSDPHIEHFRPKKRYPKLCFEWENLLLACGRCNGVNNKGSKFPLTCDGGPFINPCEEEPDAFFEFEFDASTGTANVNPKDTRGETTERELGLNRADLVKHRSSVVKKFVFFAIRASQGDAEALELLNECMDKEHEYAAFARALHQQFHLP